MKKTLAREAQAVTSKQVFSSFEDFNNNLYISVVTL